MNEEFISPRSVFGDYGSRVDARYRVGNSWWAIRRASR
jgi:hypothetical protein